MLRAMDEDDLMDERMREQEESERQYQESILNENQ